MVLKESDVTDTVNQACRRAFPFFNSCAPGSLPGLWSHFTRKQKATGIHPFGPINAKIRFPTGTEIRDLLKGTRKTTEEAGRSHLPWAVFVLRHFCAGQRQPYSLAGASQI